MADTLTPGGRDGDGAGLDRMDVHRGLLCFLVALARRGLAHCEAAQHQFGDVLGELLVDRAAGDQQPVEERPAEHIKGELEVEIGAQVAALDAASKHLGQRGPTIGQKPIAEGGRQLWPLGQGTDQVRHQPPRQRAAVELDRLSHQRQQIGAGRAACPEPRSPRRRARRPPPSPARVSTGSGGRSRPFRRRRETPRPPSGTRKRRARRSGRAWLRRSRGQPGPPAGDQRDAHIRLTA